MAKLLLQSMSLSPHQVGRDPVYGDKGLVSLRVNYHGTRSGDVDHHGNDADDAEAGPRDQEKTPGHPLAKRRNGLTVECRLDSAGLAVRPLDASDEVTEREDRVDRRWTHPRQMDLLQALKRIPSRTNTGDQQEGIQPGNRHGDKSYRASNLRRATLRLWVNNVPLMDDPYDRDGCHDMGQPRAVEIR